jgi:hypothetical protein
MEDDRFLLSLQHDLMFCEKHFEKVKAYHQVPISLVVQAMIGILMAHPEFQRLCGGDCELDIVADIRQIVQEAENIAPVCCFLGDKNMEDACLMSLPATGSNN